MPAKKSSKAKRPPTPAQRLAIEKRQLGREFQWRFESLLQTLNDPKVIPHEQRFRTLNALCCIANSGYLFALACGKAAVSRSGWSSNDPSAFWAFINAENARFAARMPADVVARWNSPDYGVPETKKESAA